MKYYYLPKRAIAIAAILSFSAVSMASATNLPLPSPESSSSITARDLKKHLSFLASDELGGRYTLSPSIRIAARYLASQLESYGLRGAARDGSFFQRVPLSYRIPDLAKSGVTVNAGGTGLDFKYADDFASQSARDIDLSGELLFAGYGLTLPKSNYDDYAGLNARGKIVVVVNGKPQALKNANFDEEEAQARAAIEHGAAGIIRIAPQNYILVWGQLKNYLMREAASLPPQPASPSAGLPSILAGPGLIRALAKSMGKDESYLMSPAGKPLQPALIPATAQIKVEVSEKEAPPAHNVVGILEGADPKLKDEYVVFSAHYDHEPTGPNGDVYNGADDDGSGTVAVLEIAQALSVGARPRRSVLIAFHTAEEIGLLGSEYNTDYEPVVPLEKIVANLNIDMIGRSRAEDNRDPRDRELTDRNSLYVIGADKLSSELHRISELTNAETARLNFDYTYNDENHPARFYYRSDHYNYAKHGIPIIFYFTGVHRDYHRATDDVEKIDFEKMERITRLIFATGWRVMNLGHRLMVDKKPEPPASSR